MIRLLTHRHNLNRSRTHFSTRPIAATVIRSTFDSCEILPQGHAFKVAIANLKAQPEVRALIQSRYSPPPTDVIGLLKSDPSSLGYHYALAIQQQRTQIPQLELMNQSDTAYVRHRLLQTYQIWQIVAGFEPIGSGDLGLQAFLLAQCYLPLAACLLSGGSGSVLPAPHNFNNLLQTITHGWDLGLQAKPFLAQRWEDHWDKPLERWRWDLDIELNPGLNGSGHDSRAAQSPTIAHPTC